MNASPVRSPIAANRAARLRRGVNLSHWFSQIYRPPGYVPAHFDTYIRITDIALIRDMGFDHVRLPINCEPLLAASGTDGRLPGDYVARIRERILEMLDHRLSVIVDIHPEDAFKRDLAQSDDTVAVFVNFWMRLAAAFADLDPEHVFFELLNEPCIHDARRWNRIQLDVAAAVRRVAPHHTLIVCGDRWSQLPELLKLEPPDDDNLIANFHLYDPHVFTHQGAGWVGPWTHDAIGLSYPPDHGQIEALIAAATDPEAVRQLTAYVGFGRDDPRAYHRFLQPAVEWARTRDLPLLCNEFGVYKKFCPRPARLAWLRDASASLLANGIGWTMWDYAGDFAVVTEDDSGARIPDREMLSALGLIAPRVNFS